MTDEESKNVQSAVLRGIKPLEDLLNNVMSADGMLGGLRLDVGDIKREQEYQSRDLEAIHLDMRGVHDTLDGMPKQWNEDIDAKIESTFAQRDDVTGAVDAAVEAERLKAEKALAAAKKSNGWLSTIFQGTGKYIFLVTMFFALSLGGVLFTKCSNLEALEQKEQEIEARDQLLREVVQVIEENGATNGSE